MGLLLLDQFTLPQCYAMQVISLLHARLSPPRGMRFCRQIEGVDIPHEVPFLQVDYDRGKFVCLHVGTVQVWCLSALLGQLIRRFC